MPEADKKTEEKSPKGQVLNIPQRSGDELASAVARALRSAREPMAQEHQFLKQVSMGPKSSKSHDNDLADSLDLEVLDLKRGTAKRAEVNSEGDSRKNGELKVLKTEVKGGSIARKKFSSMRQDTTIAEGKELIEDPVASDDKELVAGKLGLQDLPVADVKESPYQTREIDEDCDLSSLVESIRRQGVIQPVVVRRVDEGFELIAGERRLRAARSAGFSTIPALVKELSDQKACELSIVENAEREDLNPIEEALALKTLAEEFRLNQTEIGKIIGKNRATVSNMMRLLQLDEEVIEMLRSGELSAGHGRALLQVRDELLQKRLARRVISNDLSVRALERMIAGLSDAEEEYEISEEEEKALASLQRLQTRVQNMLDMEFVRLSVDGQGRKRLNLVFESEASWKRFVSRIKT